MSPKAKRRKIATHQNQEDPLMDDNIEFPLLPELLEMILTKAVLMQMYSTGTARRQSDGFIFSNLASVDFHWWISMKKPTFKNKILRVYFQRAKLRSKIIRNNRKFLKEVIDPDKIIFPLESCGCLAKDQTAFLTRLRNNKDKNHELLFMFQDFSSQKYSKMIDCLFLANQTPAALVLERGGGVVKVHINNGRESRTREFEMELIERFQRMQTENTLILKGLLNASVEKRLNDVFILHAKQNKGIELWFWCKTETSLNQLKSLSEESLREIIQRVYKKNSASLEPQLVEMDFSLASDFAERRLRIRHTRDRDILTGLFRRLEYSQRVASLGDKIYVEHDKEILVYKNTYPYQSLKSIAFEQSASPISIASCNLNKCLYISAPVDNYHTSIYTVEPEFDNRVSPWLSETGLFFVSVTSKGEVLVLNIIYRISLRMFTHEAMVKRSIALGDDIIRPRCIQEIMPDIVALCHDSSCITIMRLDENGTVLYNIDLQGTIVGLSSLRYGDLLIGVSRYTNVTVHANSSDLLSQRKQDLEYVLGDLLLQNNDIGKVQLYHWPLGSKATRDILTTNVRMDSFYFAADQKQLYVLFSSNLYIYQLNYQDEYYNR